jgi:hypothetical protein
MNAYDMNRVLFVAQERGVRRAGLQFTDHDGYIGVVLFLKRGPLAAGAAALAAGRTFRL